MIEYAAFGFAVLVWWTWPALWAVVVTAVCAAYRISAWQDRRMEDRQDREPEPCLVHMGTDPDGHEHWCWLKDGHAGQHMNQWGVPQEDFEGDPTDEEIVTIVAEYKGPQLCGWGETQQPPRLSVPMVCLRSSDCYQPDNHPGQCVLDYDHEASDAAQPALCEWGEDGKGNESACWKPHGHDGPHMVQDHFTGDQIER